MPSTFLPDRGSLTTEQVNPRSQALHTFTIAQCLEHIFCEDRVLAQVIQKNLPQISSFVEHCWSCFSLGGRLIYVGAGTSGRLGVLDAAEIPPTFQESPQRIQAILAGGDRAFRRSSEGLEDDPQGALKDLEGLCPSDTVLGISAGGTTPFVLGALQFAKKKGCLTGLLCCNSLDPLPYVDHLISVVTGPEVIAGSTRMKAGTATKMILNAISTTLMIQSGRVYGHHMVNLNVSNEKLWDRGVRILQQLTSQPRETCIDLLQQAKGQVSEALTLAEAGGIKESPPSLWIAIDGGASGSRLSVIAPEEKKEVEGQALSFTSLSPLEIRQNLKDLLERAEIYGSLQNHRIIAGIAGAGKDEGRNFFSSLFVEWGAKEERISIFNDVELALKGLPDPCILLCAGTGSICYGKSQGQQVSSGGWGHFLGDEGSGFWMGQQYLKAVLAAQEGWGGLHLKEKIQNIPQSKKAIAQLAPFILKEAEQGEEVALEIVQKACEELTQLVFRTQKKLQKEKQEILPLYGMGGLFSSSFFSSLLIKKLGSIQYPPQLYLQGALSLYKESTIPK